jgi:hypothetical protein
LPRKAGATAYVIEIGQRIEGSSSVNIMKPAARNTWGDGPVEAHGEPCRPAAAAAVISA